MDVVNTKPWYVSKTIWFNVITVIVSIIMLLSQMPDFAEYNKWFTLLVGIMNIVLRAITTTPVTLSSDGGVRLVDEDH